jgi:hypothetical protein
MRRTAAPTPRAAAALQALEDWRNAGSSRLDADLDGWLDHPGAAVIDAAWSRLADAALGPFLGPLVDQLGAVVSRDQPFNAGGSSFYEGWWSYIDKDLRTLLGKPVRGPYMTRFCALVGARRRGGRARGRAGRRPRSLARQRVARADSLRPRPPDRDDAGNEPADVPAGDHVRRPSTSLRRG